MSLTNAWDRTVATASADSTGEILWKHIPLGDSYFYAQARGFYPHRAGVAICDGREQTISVRLAPVPEGSLDSIIVNGAASMMETIPMPNCQALDLTPVQPKPANHRWWRIF